MPVPTRPVAAAVIGSVWGQQVHDFTFAPAGCLVHGIGLTMLAANAYRDQDISLADDDPGGYLDAANDRVEVPADGEGLYLIVMRASTLNGDAGDETGIVLRINGTETARVQVGNEGTTRVAFSLTIVEMLSAGDQISLRSRHIGGGSVAGVTLESLALVRLRYEMGAPS